jgi:hypothetical protein
MRGGVFEKGGMAADPGKEAWVEFPGYYITLHFDARAMRNVRSPNRFCLDPELCVGVLPSRVSRMGKALSSSSTYGFLFKKRWVKGAQRGLPVAVLGSLDRTLARYKETARQGGNRGQISRKRLGKARLG